MAPRKESGDKPARKSAFSIARPFAISEYPADCLSPAKSGAAGGKKGKVSPYNKFMKDELARLKESNPELKHPDRYASFLLPAERPVLIYA